MNFNMDELTLTIEQAVSDFQKEADVNRLLSIARAAIFEFVEEIVVQAIQRLLISVEFLATLKILAGKSALRFKGYRSTTIRLLSGRAITIESPYFAKADSKVRRGPKRKKRQAGTGCHLGLCYMGLIDRCSMLLASSAVQAALLCPSFEIAARLLKSFGVEMDVKTIYRLCMSMGKKAIEHRSRIALTEADGASGRTLFVCMDGGRLRERRTRRGRRPAGRKRQGYHTDWREPIQIVINRLDPDGEESPQAIPLYDATMGGIDGAFDLLEEYLRQLDVSNADRVIFCADGARGYWKRFSALAEKLDIKTDYQVIDYTHAKQNLRIVAEKLPQKIGERKRAAIFEEWKKLLWLGRLEDIGRGIKELITSPTKRKQALRKFKNYFLDNRHRMEYAFFKSRNIPTGSGCVESAIRRVINLRLKSPGIFWKKETAEVMLFLRSSLLCGRWDILLGNLFRLQRGELEKCH